MYNIFKAIKPDFFIKKKASVSFFKTKILLVCTFYLITILNISFVHAGEYIDINAKSGILIEQTTGKILYSKDKDARMYPASMTKILTAMVALDYLSPEEIIVCGPEVNGVPIDSSKAGHRQGEALSVENLIRGLIIPSGNETACVVAKAVALREKGVEEMNYESAEILFSDLMNKKAKSLGANNSNFVNPHGYHDENHYTTANDLVLICREAVIKYDLIKKISKETSFKGNGVSENPDPSLKTREYNWSTHNWLLNNREYSYPYATGLKTGYTGEAGYCLAASAERDDKSLISVVFDSTETERYNDTKKLFEFGFLNFDFEIVQEPNKVIEEVKIAKPKLGEDDILEISTTKEFKDYLSKDELSRITHTVTFNQELIAVNKESEDTTIRFITPIEKDQNVGEIIYTLDGKEVYKDHVVSTRDVETRTIKTDIIYYFEQFKTNVFSPKAIPYWAGGIFIMGCAAKLISAIKNRRTRKNYGFRSRGRK